MLVDRDCFNNHMGRWLIWPDWLAEAVASIQSGAWKAAGRDVDGEVPSPQVPTYDGVAVIPVAGPTMKGWSKFGGTSTVWVRQALRAAMASESVRAVAMKIDSPGGHVAGTQELADDVWELQRRHRKPIHAHFDDLGTSAALWVGSQASRVTANRTAQIGSVGVIGALVDTSKKAEMEGVRVIPLTTGKHKMTGLAGVEIDDEQVDRAQGLVDGLMQEFMSALRRGGMTVAQVEEVRDGRVVLAPEAARLGMIDEVMSWEEALGAVPRAPRRSRSAAAFAALRREADGQV